MFNNKAIMVTGASRGLGLALANELAAKGARLALLARSGELLETLARQINERHGAGKAFAFTADVGDKKAIYPLVARATALLGPIQALFNNAGTLGPNPLKPLSDTDCEELETAIQTNVLGPFRLIKAVLGHMVLEREGLIVNITSDASLVGYPGWGAYSASKAALDSLTRGWPTEIVGQGVRFYAIDPGEMNTVMHADAVPGADKSLLLEPSDAARQILRWLEFSSETVASGSRVLVTGGSKP
jgi:NAD(P)-dependent dehydrogenase (short-subunit alcohol dehydrogenase family)